MAKNKKKQKKSKSHKRGGKKLKKQLPETPLELEQKASGPNRDKEHAETITELRQKSVVADSQESAAVARNAAIGNRRQVARPVNVSTELSENATVLFSIAAGIALLMTAAALFLPEGLKSANAIAGFSESGVPLRTLQIMLLLDSLFPAFLYSGFALLATAVQSRGNRPLVRLVLTALLVVLISDLAENASTYLYAKSGEPGFHPFLMTINKYGGLAFVSIILSAILPREGKLGVGVVGVLRYALPIAAVLLASEIAHGTFRNMILLGAIPLIFLLAAYAQALSDRDGAGN